MEVNNRDVSIIKYKEKYDIVTWMSTERMTEKVLNK